MADYLEAYAARFELPVRTGVRVDRLSRNGGGFVAASGARRFEADNVVVAMSSWQRPRVPRLAAELDPDIVQLHSAHYRNPGQLRDGDLLLVGAEFGRRDRARRSPRPPCLAVGARRRPCPVPHRVARRAPSVPLVLPGVFHRLLTVRTPMGRKKRAEALSHGLPLVRTKPSDLAASGIERVPRVAGVRDGRPELEGGRVLDVANVVWCTGFDSIWSGSTFPASHGAIRRPSAASWPISPGCTSSGFSSCTRCHRRWSTASRATPSTSRSTSPHATLIPRVPRSRRSPPRTSFTSCQDVPAGTSPGAAGLARRE